MAQDYWRWKEYNWHDPAGNWQNEGKMLTVGVEHEFAITGGIAKNSGVVKRLEGELKLKALTPRHDPQIAGAVGAALFARTLAQKEDAVQGTVQ